MKVFKRGITILCGVVLSAGLIMSCSQDPVTPVQSNEIPQEIKQALQDLRFDISDLKVVTDSNPLTGTSELKYQVEGDLLFTGEQILQMAGNMSSLLEATEEQFATDNLVTGLPRTISVCGYTGGSFALDSKMQTGLQWAINNYNALGLQLTFTLTFTTAFSGFDITVYKGSGSGAGGSAGFPDISGDPYPFIQILPGTSAFSTNVMEHVMTHEIGHCIGMRHSDYHDRSFSCGSGGSEGSAPFGANPIPGTPKFDPNSIFNSCFSSNQNGEFSAFDIIALEFLY